MKKASYSLLILAFTCLMSPHALLAQGAEKEGAVKGVYTVKEGDTLGKIAREQLKGPASLQRLLRANPDIKDPRKIYPGEKIVIPGAGEESAGGTGAVVRRPALKAEEKEEPFVKVGKTVDRIAEKKKDTIVIAAPPKPKEPVATESKILTAGFIAKDLSGARMIIGSPTLSKNVFTQMDEVYLKPTDGIKKGDRFLIFRPGAKVFHPATDGCMGYMISTTGTMTVTDIKDGYPVGVVDMPFTDVLQSDLLFPLDETPLAYEPIPDNPGLKGKWGYVAAIVEKEAIASTLTTVYLDMGKNDGVKPGDRFVIRRSGGSTGLLAEGRHYIKAYILPDIVVGEVQVISVQPETSTATVVEFREPMYVGFRAYYKD